MRKRTRPSFLRQLEKRYGPKRKALEEGTRPLTPIGEQPKGKLPRVYPIKVNTPKPTKLHPAPSKGVIDMSIQQFVTLAVTFMLLAWVGSGAVAFGVVELTAGGPQGEIGLPGPEGEQGVAGPPGIKGEPGDDAAQESIKRMATLWAVQQASAIRGGTFVELNDPQVGSCVEYVLKGETNVGACPGFSVSAPAANPQATSAP